MHGCILHNYISYLSHHIIIILVQAHQEYLDLHKIQEKVENVINDVVKSKPAEPFAHMVRGLFSNYL